MKAILISAVSNMAKRSLLEDTQKYGHYRKHIVAADIDSLPIIREVCFMLPSIKHDQALCSLVGNARFTSHDKSGFSGRFESN